MKSFGKIPHAVLIIKLISSNAAFISSSRNPIWKCPLSMKMAKADSSNEIKEAFRISKEFGASSKEARVAWDIVEEIDASDNMRQAFERSKPDELIGLPQNAKEYVNTISSLSDILSNVIEPAIGPIKTLISNIKKAEKDDPKLSELGGPLPEVLAAMLSEAKAADDIYGPSSSKSTDAWHRAENLAMDIDISGMKPKDEELHDPSLRYKEAAVTSHHDYFTVVDPAFLEEAMEALVQLEHFTSLVAIEKNRLLHSFEKAGDEEFSSTKQKP